MSFPGECGTTSAWLLFCPRKYGCASALLSGFGGAGLLPKPEDPPIRIFGYWPSTAPSESGRSGSVAGQSLGIPNPLPLHAEPHLNDCQWVRIPRYHNSPVPCTHAALPGRIQQDLSLAGFHCCSNITSTTISTTTQSTSAIKLCHQRRLCCCLRLSRWPRRRAAPIVSSLTGVVSVHGPGVVAPCAGCGAPIEAVGGSKSSTSVAVPGKS